MPACPDRCSRAPPPRPPRPPGSRRRTRRIADDQLRHRVLGRDRVVQQRRVQRPAGLAPQHPGRGDHLADRVEDPLRPVTGPQLVAPQREHRRMEPLVVERQPGRDLPTQIGAQRLRARPGPTSPPATAAPSPWRSHRPAPTAGPDPTGTDQRTARPGTAAGGARPRTRTPSRPAPDARPTPPRPTTPGSDPTALHTHHSFRSAPKTRAPPDRIAQQSPSASSSSGDPTIGSR